MYPLNMQTADGTGFAVANDAAEHSALSDAGYLPPVVESADGLPETADAVVKRGPGRPRKVAE